MELIAKELAEKQTIADRWAKLNNLIGSADGAKFKVIAQSYTLNLLLLHANKHLSYLSKRYKLQQVPDTLALQYVSPVITLLSVCARQPEREAECLEKLDAHVRLIFRTFIIKRGEP